MSAKYRKLPVVIDAVQFTKDNWMEVIDFIGIAHHNNPSGGGAFVNREGCLTIKTLEGEMRADPGDWIIKGVAGEFYPCKPDIFKKTYVLIGSAPDFVDGASDGYKPS